VTACLPPRTVVRVAPAAIDRAAPDSFVVRMATTKGDVDLMVHRDWSPRGADRLYGLVRYRFYDGARFFRAVPGFVVQFGLAADPAMTAVMRSQRIADDAVHGSNTRGMLSFATGGPNTRTTQLFINLKDNARLDGMGFSPVGQVIAGMAVVDSLYQGYGEGAPRGKGPSQDRITAEGEPYLQRDFPLLDQIQTARVVRHFGGPWWQRWWP
jgi:peptidyl-prolyl cis-trans isomerase A (cyclophilin A)